MTEFRSDPTWWDSRQRLHLSRGNADAHGVRPAPAAAIPLASVARARQRTRAFVPTPVDEHQLLDLLRAGFGIAPGSWGRAAPAHHNWHEVTIYALRPEGACRYDPHAHHLVPVREGDVRGATGAQEPVLTAPLTLVYVVDLDPVQQVHAEEHGIVAGADAGSIVENIHRACACAGLGNMVRSVPDPQRLARALGLKPTQRVVLAQTIGHPQPEPH